MNISLITLHKLSKLTGFLIALAVFMICGARFESVSAQQFAFSLKPAYSHIIAKPGSPIVLPYTLTNNGDPTVVTLQVYFLSVKDSTGSYELIPYNSDVPNLPQFTTSDAALKINEPFLISSQEAVEFDLIAATQENTEEGDYYFTLVVVSEPSEGFEDTSRIILQSGIGSNLYLSVSKEGTIQTTGEITQFSVQPQYSFQFGDQEYAFFDSYQPVPLILQVANKGKRLLQTSGTLTIHSVFRNDIRVITIPKQLILANSQRLLNSSSTESDQSSETSTTVLPGEFIGAYTARTNLQIGSDSEQKILSIHYYVFPIRYTVFLLIITSTILFVPLVVRSLRK